MPKLGDVFPSVADLGGAFVRGQPYEPEHGRKERFGGSRARTESRNMAATRFSDSATPTCVKIESRPKYTTTSGLTSTTFFANFSENT